jgi:hypothetical protein
VLTHDKFTAAAPYVALWVAFILAQCTGKPQTAVLFVERRGLAIGGAGLAVRAAGIALLAVLVPAAGIAGAYATLFAQHVALRIAYHLQVRRYGTVPFQDGWAIAGCVAIGVALLADRSLEASFAMRSVAFVGAVAIMGLMGHAMFREIVLLVRQSRSAGWH